MIHKKIIATSQEAFEMLAPLFHSDQEEIWILGLNRGLECMITQCCFRGSVDTCLIHPREIFAPLLQVRATQFILAHNHPRGSAEPSVEDIEMTKLIEKAGRILMIPLIDHIIIGQNLTFCSFQRLGFLRKSHSRVNTLL